MRPFPWLSTETAGQLLPLQQQLSHGCRPLPSQLPLPTRSFPAFSVPVSPQVATCGPAAPHIARSTDFDLGEPARREMACCPFRALFTS